MLRVLGSSSHPWDTVGSVYWVPAVNPGTLCASCTGFQQSTLGHCAPCIGFQRSTLGHYVFHVLGSSAKRSTLGHCVFHVHGCFCLSLPHFLVSTSAKFEFFVNSLERKKWLDGVRMCGCHSFWLAAVLAATLVVLGILQCWLQPWWCWACCNVGFNLGVVGHAATLAATLVVLGMLQCWPQR